MRTDDGFNLEIRRGLPPELRTEAAKLYLEAFGRKLSPMVGTGERAAGLLQDALEPELCFVALDGLRLLGLVGMQFGGRAFTQ
ncbi:MAG: hypothetical protein SFU83_12740, partial [Meiothermus sp.]|nr:hypothetical protein [Meiothermus sp.]